MGGKEEIHKRRHSQSFVRAQVQKHSTERNVTPTVFREGYECRRHSQSFLRVPPLMSPTTVNCGGGGGGEMVKRREKESKGGFNEATSSALTARPAFSSQIPVLLVDGPS